MTGTDTYRYLDFASTHTSTGAVPYGLDAVNHEVSVDRSATSGARLLGALVSGAVIGIIGGLVGLGGAEFRLPLLLAVFGFIALEAVILNKTISLVVVASALLFRGAVVPFADVLAHWPILLNLLAGSLVGAWLGADLATRLSTEALYRVIALLHRSATPAREVPRDATVADSPSKRLSKSMLDHGTPRNETEIVSVLEHGEAAAREPERSPIRTLHARPINCGPELESRSFSID